MQSSRVARRATNVLGSRLSPGRVDGNGMETVWNRTACAPLARPTITGWLPRWTKNRRWPWFRALSHALHCRAGTAPHLVGTRARQTCHVLPATARAAGPQSGLPDYGAVHSQVVLDFVRRVDQTYQAFFWRIQAG